MKYVLIDIAKGSTESLELSPSEAEVLNNELFNRSHALKSDFALIPEEIYNTPKKLAIFDMDSTLIQEEVIVQIAKENGTGGKVKEITNEAMEGKLDFTQSLVRRVALLEGFPKEKMQEVFNTLNLSAGIVPLFKIMQAKGIKTAIASGGFTFFAHQFQNQLRIDDVYANDLEFKNDKLSGKVQGEIVDAERKRQIVHELAKKYNLGLNEIMTVGDGANDIPMLLEVGLGVAVHAKRTVQEKVKYRLNYSDMMALLPLMNIKNV